MSLASAFWDSSALAPLCIIQPTSAHARLLFRQFSIVAWWGTSVEVHSSVARLHRSGGLTAENRKLALTKLQLLSLDWQPILPSETVRDFALNLLDQYALRAADSLQLAAALFWCQHKPMRRNFICADIRLSEAAASAGFTVVQI